MSLWQDIQPWIDVETGLMTAADGGRDNLILMSVYLAKTLMLVGESDAAINLYAKIVTFASSVQVAPGLFRRLPGDTSNNSIDNLIGMCAFSASRASDVRNRWNSRFSCFDVNYPDKIALNSNFFGRFVGIKAFILEAAIKPSWFIQRLLWCASTIFSVHFSSGASGPLLASLQVDVMESVCPNTCAYWKKHNSLPDLYAQYFGPNHPITIYSKKVLTSA